MRKVLVVVDMQNDFIDGVLGTPEAQAIVPNVVEKIKNVDKENTLILFTKDTHYDDYLETLEGKILPVPHCIENTKGWCINKEVSSAFIGTPGYLLYSDNAIVNNRIYKNTFGSDILEAFLVEHANEIDELEFCGVCTSICVVSNVLMARQKLSNTKITVDASCCACVTPESHKAALTTMRMCQINVIGE